MNPASEQPRSWPRLASVGLALALVGCGRGPAPAASTALPEGVVARVAGVDIRAEMVLRIAAAQRVSVVEARDIAVRDLLLARGAIDRGLDRTPAFERDRSSALARLVLRRLLDDARRAPPTEAELAASAERRWLDVDRPEGSRTVHAVVRYSADRDPEEKRARAEAVAQAIRAAALPISARASTLPLVPGAPNPSARQLPADDPDPLSGAFRAAALATAGKGLEVTVEPLPAISADGRILAMPVENVDLDFARAAAALTERGALSPVIRSWAGFHVIMLLERTPARVLTGEARSARLFSDIVNERARAADKRLLAALRERGAAAPDAPGLLELVHVEP